MMRINKTEIKTKNRAWIVLFTILSVVIIAQLLASNYLAGKGEYLSLLEKNSSGEKSQLFNAGKPNTARGVGTKIFFN